MKQVATCLCKHQSIHKFPDICQWIKNCLEQVFQFYKRKTTQYNTAKFTQPRPNMAAPLHWDTTYEKVVNWQKNWSLPCLSLTKDKALTYLIALQHGEEIWPSQESHSRQTIHGAIRVTRGCSRGLAALPGWCLRLLGWGGCNTRPWSSMCVGLCACMPVCVCACISALTESIL